MIRVWSMAALALTACSGGADDAGEAGPSAPDRAVTGSYIVDHVGEAPPVIGIEGSEATVTITANRIHFQSQCVFDDWRYTLEGEAIATGRWQASQEMCARALAPGEEAIIAAIGAADTLRHVPRGLRLSGAAGTVQLRFVPSAEDLASRTVDLSGSWTVAMLDGRALASPIPLEADWHGIWWEPGCAGQGVSYTIDGQAFDALPPELTQAWSALAAADTIVSMRGGEVRIAGGGRSVRLAAR